MKKLTAFFLLIAGILLVSTECQAWGGPTHRKVTSDAYYIMPKAFRQFLGEIDGNPIKEPRLKALLEACREPDTILKDFRNHVFHIQGYDLGNGPFHVEDLAKELAEDIKNKAPMAKIVQKFGWLSHYCADLAQPLHTGVATWEGIEEKSYHSAYEKDIDKQVNTFGVNFDGANAITRISARMVYESLWANQYYTAVEKAYTDGNKYPEVKDATAKCYSRAVNNVVDIWYCVWAMAGGKVDSKADGKPKYYPPAGKNSLMKSEWDDEKDQPDQK